MNPTDTLELRRLLPPSIPAGLVAPDALRQLERLMDITASSRPYGCGFEFRYGTPSDDAYGSFILALRLSDLRQALVDLGPSEPARRRLVESLERTLTQLEGQAVGVVSGMLEFDFDGRADYQLVFLTPSAHASDLREGAAALGDRLMAHMPDELQVPWDQATLDRLAPGFRLGSLGFAVGRVPAEVRLFVSASNERALPLLIDVFGAELAARHPSVAEFLGSLADVRRGELGIQLRLGASPGIDGIELLNFRGKSQGYLERFDRAAEMFSFRAAKHRAARAWEGNLGAWTKYHSHFKLKLLPGGAVEPKGYLAALQTAFLEGLPPVA
jgi:hypothetical protein